MSKSLKKVKKTKYKNDIKFDGSLNFEAKSVVITIASVLAIFTLFYFLTSFILERDSNVSSSSDDKIVNVQYDDILAGSSFSMGYDEYFVLYYNFGDEDLSLDSTVYTYRSNSDNVKLFTVDLSDSLNSSFVADSESNPSVTTVADLKVKNPTLIKFVNNSVAEYVEDIGTINEYLS